MHYIVKGSLEPVTEYLKNRGWSWIIDTGGESGNELVIHSNGRSLRYKILEQEDDKIAYEVNRYCISFITDVLLREDYDSQWVAACSKIRSKLLNSVYKVAVYSPDEQLSWMQAPFCTGNPDDRIYEMGQL